MIVEEYKNFPHPEFSNKYKVSNLGKIINIKTNTVLKSYESNDYLYVRINNIKFRIDIMVAKCFLGDSDMFLSHMDRNKKNNKVCNLSYTEITSYLNSVYKNIWKCIDNYKEYYISTKGDVWSLFTEKILSPQLSHGYKRINLGGKKNSIKKYIHVLVASAFLENPNNYKVVNHKNGIKIDCALNNLEWVSNSENCLHSIYILGNDNLNSQSKEKVEEPKDDVVELSWLENYLITKDGRIYSKKNRKFLTLHERLDGYMSVHIKNKGYKVHRLVASAFLPEPSKEQIYVNHKNLIKNDNRVENLEWISPKENTQHAVDNKPLLYVNQQIKVACLDKDTNEIITIYDSLAKAAKDKNIKSSGNISNVCRGVAKTTGGYKWKYI